MDERSALAASSPTSYGPTPSADEVAWLRRCLPIFMQPQVDVDIGNPLVKVFFEFVRGGTAADADAADAAAEAAENRLDCRLCIVFAGESSYNLVVEEKENVVATLFYRTFNRRTYKRTADINYLEFRDIDLAPHAAQPWASIFTCDHGGAQRWAHGEKRTIMRWFSLMHHYNVDVPYASWDREMHRPRLYLNTCNHMIGECDNNPHLRKREWREYAFQAGDADTALQYVVQHVPTKFNLYSWVCFWKARNGGRIADRHPTGTVTRTRLSIYMDEDEANAIAMGVVKTASSETNIAPDSAHSTASGDADAEIA